MPVKEKNRFSQLLEHLLRDGGVKNYAIAQSLQYDVSYISKWINGSMLPSEKVSDKVLETVSRCVATMSTEEGAQTLMSDYQVDSRQDLQGAIFDHLQIEYEYVRKAQSSETEQSVTNFFYYPELSLPQYLAKMNHPVLRQVKSLKVMAVFDLMSVAHEYRLQVVKIGKRDTTKRYDFRGVHFSMLINLETATIDYVYDTIFLLSMLTDMTNIDFELYSSTQATGRMVFAVKDGFSISGMLMGSNRSVSVVVTEDVDATNRLYYNMAELCGSEMLLLRKTTMQEMLLGGAYAHSLLSPHPRWMLGRMTEYFLPDDLFEELLEASQDQYDQNVSVEHLRNLHMLTRNTLRQSPVQIILFVDAFTNLAVSSELDFFNYKIHLTPEQKANYMNHILHLFQSQKNLSVKLVYSRLVSDSHYLASQCLLLSDTFSYLRLDINNGRNNLHILNRPNIRELFERFYSEMWAETDEHVVSDSDSVVEFVRHIIHGVSLIPED